MTIYKSVIILLANGRNHACITVGLLYIFIEARKTTNGAHFLALVYDVAYIP